MEAVGLETGLVVQILCRAAVAVGQEAVMAAAWSQDFEFRVVAKVLA